MGCISADDANLLPAGKKIVRYDMSGVAACSQYNVHKLPPCLAWMPEAAVWTRHRTDGLSLGAGNLQEVRGAQDSEGDSDYEGKAAAGGVVDHSRSGEMIFGAAGF